MDLQDAMISMLADLQPRDLGEMDQPKLVDHFREGYLSADQPHVTLDSQEAQELVQVIEQKESRALYHWRGMGRAARQRILDLVKSEGGDPEDLLTTFRLRLDDQDPMELPVLAM